MTSNPHDIKGVLCLLGKVSDLSIDDRLSPLASATNANYPYTHPHHQIYPKPGTGPQMLEWIGKLKAGVQNEPGTLEYSWAQNGDELLIWERYADAAAFET